MSVRLGKLEYRPDERTARMGIYLAPVEKVPEQYDHDKRRAPFPISPLGNDQWGNCVIVGRANQTLRAERIERRNTPNILTSHVVEEYKRECERQFGRAPQSPGDPYDGGLYVHEAIKDWRGEGWMVLPTRRSRRARQQSVAAYGELEPTDRAQLRAAIFTLHGIQMGIWLPATAGQQWRSGQAWDVVPGDSPDTRPGSWGGHLVYAKAYDSGGIYCLTWGREVYMTNAFVEKYCDEAWAVVDNFENAKHSLDVQKLVKYLRDLGVSNIG